MNLTGFKHALESIFGAGAPYLEKIIAQFLYAKLGLDFEDIRDTDLVLSVDDAKRRIARAGEVKVDE